MVFVTGTPTFFDRSACKESNFDIRELDDTTATAEQFDAPTNRITDPLPVLYQSGYLTIKGYRPEFSALYPSLPQQGSQERISRISHACLCTLPARDEYILYM